MASTHNINPQQADEHNVTEYYQYLTSPQQPQWISRIEDADSTVVPQVYHGTTPYLGLRARLSQVWVNRWTILILLALARVLLGIRDLNGDLASAKREALSACGTVEDMGSAMASMPHYLAGGVNDLTAMGIEKAVNGLFAVTVMSITVVEEILWFVINMVIGLYACLITFAVGGVAHAAVAVLADSQKTLATLTSGLGDDMAAVVKGFNTALNDAISVVDKLGANIKPLDFDGEITKLKNLQLPANFSQKLVAFNNSIPDFSQVQNATKGAMDIPFEMVRNLTTKALGNYTFDRSVFTVPQREQLTFCSDTDGINGFFKGLDEVVIIATKIFIAILVGAAIISCIPMGYRELRRWRTMIERSKLVTMKASDPMDVVYIVSRPYTATFGLWLSSKFSGMRRQTLVRWIVAYATTEAALFVLALGLAGLFTCLCHYLLLRSIQKEVPALTNEVSDFAGKITDALFNASEAWARSTNAVIIKENNRINNDMLGWVNISVTAVDSALDTFTNETTKLMHAVFGNGELENVVQGLYDCLIGMKITAVESALNWINDHAHVAFPLLPNDTFSAGALASIQGDQTANSSFLASPGDATSDKITSAVDRVTTSLHKGIEIELYISSIVCLIWVILLLIGCFRACLYWFGHDDELPSCGRIREVRDLDLNLAPKVQTDEIKPPHATTFTTTTAAKPMVVRARSFLRPKKRNISTADVGAPMNFRADNQDNFVHVPLEPVMDHGHRNEQEQEQKTEMERPHDPSPEYSRDPFHDDKAVGYMPFSQGGWRDDAIRAKTGIWPADVKR